MKNGFFYSGNLRLYYEIDGEGGTPMLLLNGGPGLSHDYLQSMHALTPEAQLIYFDQRGTGKSDKAAPGGYTVDANVEDLENLRCALGLDAFILFGHSWGGMLAQAYTLRCPERVGRLILADTFDSAAGINQALTRMRASVPPETEAVYQKWEREGLYNGRDRYPEEYQAAVDLAYAPVQISVTPPEYIQDVFSQLAYDVYREMWGEQSEFTITGTLAAADFTPRLGEIRVPTLVIVGASDMPTVEQARRMAGAIPNARLAVFEHSCHFPMLEEPEKFFALLRAFIREG